MTGSYERMVAGRVPESSPVGAVGGQIAEGRIHHLDLAGAWVTLPAFDGGRRVLGPCPWNQALVQDATTTDSNGDTETHGHTPTLPAPGSPCLLVWVNAVQGVHDGRWWVVAWWSG